MNQLKSILQSPAVQNRSMILVLSFTAVLCLAAFLMTGKTISSYRNYHEVKAQTVDMRKTIAEWNKQNDYITHQPYRPVPAKQVDAVNSDLLAKLQEHHLQLTNYQMLANSGKKAVPYRTYNIKFTGNYPDVIDFLTDFHTKDALVSLLRLNLSEKGNLIQADVFYRIYVK